ncbi:MAG: response regulator transcription factor [Planctomycetes bacterium]|nr:response regulator transcription factor [Planctomycetota bacterium]
MVDDDEALRRSLEWLLGSVSLQAESYASANEFLEAYDPDRPGCLVLDVRLVGMSGLELQETLTARGIPLPVIIVTGHADVAMAIRVLHAGAIDLIEKPYSDQALLDRVHQAISLDAERRRERLRHAGVRARLERLTPREREVMDLVVAGKANKQIAAALHLSPKTVEVHRASVMKKLEADSIAALVRMAVAIETDGRSS